MQCYKNPNAPNIVPREKPFLLALFMGFVGSLTLATERFGLFYWGRAEGNDAVRIGYVIALVSCYILYCYFRPISGIIKNHLILLIIFSALYSISLALPFFLDLFVSNKIVIALSLSLTPIAIVYGGHLFHCRLNSLSEKS